jgi:DNA (cytosine-5)-methyltransferase 1
MFKESDASRQGCRQRTPSLHSFISQRPIAVDLFAGAGGLSFGFEQVGFDILAAVEIDPVHCATHKFNFPCWSVLCRDIREITAKEIREVSGIGDRDIDVVFGGPPCQGFSLIGKRSLEDPRNSLVFHFLRLILELQPKYFVMENVPGIAIGKHENFLAEIIQKLRINGYKVEENYQILNAANYGVPQNRSRLFLLGCRPAFELPKYPDFLTQNLAKLSTLKKQSSLSPPPTVLEALKDLPEVNNYAELKVRDWTVAKFGEPSHYANQLRGFFRLEDDYSYRREYDSKLLTSSMRTQHTSQSVQRFSDTLPGKIEPISRFFKLSPDGLCNTLRAGTDGSLGAYTSPRPIHYSTPRCITVREAARLHSYPDWFRFHKTKWHGFRQIGNSVPPLLGKAVAKKIINALGVQSVTPVEIIKLGDPKLLNLTYSKATKYLSKEN